MIKLLFFDDEVSWGKSIKRVFRDSSQFEIRVEHSAVKLLQIIQDFKPDVVITDIMMPDKDGMEVLQELGKSHPMLPIIAISGGGPFGTEYTLETAKLLGAAKIIAKPFDIETIYDAVMDCVQSG